MELHTQIGRHDAQIEALERDIKDLREDIKAMTHMLHEVNRTLSEAKGGWRMLMLVGGVAAAIGAGAAKIVGWLQVMPR